MWLSSRRLRCLVLAATIGLAPACVRAAAMPDIVARQIDAAADSGPRALLDGLAQVLAANPDLAATPDAAAALARTAAAPVPDFVGANLPIYREIAAQIIAAAPPAQREAVREAVGRELTRYVANDIRIMPTLQPDTIGNVPTQPPEVGAAGFRVGSFTVYPEVQGGTFYDSNIYATPTARVSDWAATISPRIAVQSNWERNALYAEAGTDLTGYWNHGSENTVDWHTLVEGRIDVSDDTRILLGGIALKEHEDRSSPDVVEGLTPTPYWELNGYAGVVHRFGDFNVRAAGAVERLTFGNVEGLHGEINNQDRNRNRYTFGVLARDDARPGFRPFVEGLGDFRDYDQTTDDFGYQRSSNGYRAGVGALFRLAPALSGQAFVGVMGRYYADPTFKPVIAPAADADVRWQAGKNTAFVVFLDRSIEETTLPGSPAYIYTVVGGRLEQALRRDLTGILRLAFAHSAFQQVSRWDNEADMSVGLRYYLTKLVYLGLDYRYTQRVSGDSTVNFSRNEVFFTVGSSF
jgi:hypothetical protein